MGLKGGPSEKNKGKGGSRKILPLLEGGREKKLSYLGGGFMQLSNDTSKKFHQPPLPRKKSTVPYPILLESVTIY